MLTPTEINVLIADIRAYPPAVVWCDWGTGPLEALDTDHLIEYLQDHPETTKYG